MPSPFKILTILLVFLTLIACEPLPAPESITEESSLIFLSSFNEISDDLLEASIVKEGEKISSFDDENTINQITSPSGKYQAYIKKYALNKEVIIQGENQAIKTLKTNEVVRYELILHDQTEERVIETYYKHQPFHLRPFFLGNFINDEKFFEYSRSKSSVSELKIYDIDEQKSFSLKIAGLPNFQKWYNDHYIICVDQSFKGLPSSIVAIQPPHWRVSEQYFIYPDTLNKNKEGRLSQLQSKEINNLPPKNCHIEDSNLTYKIGEEEISFDLSLLDDKDILDSNKTL